ncbi:preprotein translocase subunit YajC [Victivallis sp. Marseille-Q1083]|uniref:preprotein translocase subunit YajC n=1 Tax=Victivallis sp. Marseille-Q1083 TaxID=2717288 RepID=UPI00158A4E25|nr:preprotein translocase subunit YajC [Victivallis sp. Marseille-Q1083]
MYHYTVSTAILAADGNAEAQNAAPVAPAGGEQLQVTIEGQQVPEEAPAQPQAQQGGMLGMLPFIILIALMFFLMIRSQKKQAKKRQEILSQIKKGDKVVTNAGIYGVVQEVKDQTYILEIADKVRVEMVKNGVAGKVNSAEAADAGKNA